MAKDKQANSYSVVLFHSTSGALMAEKLLKKEGIAYKIIPVPRNLSSDCGVCLRFSRQDESLVRKALAEKVEFQSICNL
ncbi:MAG: DUF3343 domain-containing protein [Deltaproteobacteria bacterium]|nr:DUF3343 domain-containing protein [Deltaproteobacteria bacterium]